MSKLTPQQIEAAAEAVWQAGYHDDYHDRFKDQWVEGFRAAHTGKDLRKDNPYKLSGHERDTTHEDECHFQWYSGWLAADEQDATLWMPRKRQIFDSV